MRITEPVTLRALAHPLRLDLLEVLTITGPATAAACAQRLGASQASCSFHLRQLAKYGYVERAPSAADGRERPWRLTSPVQEWSVAELGSAAQHLDRVLIQREADRMLDWVETAQGEPIPWRRAAFAGGATLPLTSDELTGLREQLRAALEPFMGRLEGRAPHPAGARPVRIAIAGTPLRIGESA